MKASHHLFMAISLIIFSLPVFSNQCDILPTEDLDVVAVFDRLIDDYCFESTCDDQLCQSVSEYESLEFTKESRDDVINDAFNLTRDIKAKIELLPDQPQWLINFKNNINTSTQQFLLGHTYEINTSELQPNHFHLYESHDDNSTPFKHINLKTELANACPDSSYYENPSSGCMENFENTKRAYLYQSMQYLVFRKVLEPQRKKTETYISELNTKWQKYSAKARALYPWERGLNAYLYLRDKKNQKGFPQPPNQQFFFLHPSLSMEYNSNSDDNFDEALTLELIGFERWNYDSEIKQYGASLVAAYSDSTDDIGYGALFHLPKNLSLGFIRRDGETSTILSVDFAKLFIDGGELRKTIEQRLNINN